MVWAGNEGALLFPLCESTLLSVDALTATKALPVSVTPGPCGETGVLC